jgi:hypothetical protein
MKMNEPTNVENKQQYELKDEHVKQLKELSDWYHKILTHVGAMYVELQENSVNAINIRKSLEAVQNDICIELSIPHSKRLFWNMEKKIVEVVN